MEVFLESFIITRYSFYRLSFLILAKSRIGIHLLLCSIRVMKCRACKIFDTLQLNDRCAWGPSIFKSNFEHFLHQTPPRRSKTWEAETTFDGSTDVRWQQNTFVREFYLNQEISTMWVGEPDYLITWTQTATCRKRKRSKKIHSTAPLFFAKCICKKAWAIHLQNKYKVLQQH